MSHSREVETVDAGTQSLTVDDLRSPAPNRQLVAALLATLIVVFFGNNLFIPPLFTGGSRSFVIGIPVGVCIAQVNLISVWAAVSPGHVIIRLPWAYLLVELMWVSLVLGNRWNGNSLNNGDILSLALVLAVCCTVAQIPLWIASRIFRWRLCGPAASAESKGEVVTSQFQLRHMFLGTVILAISLALIRTLFLGTSGDFQIGLDQELYTLLPVLTVVNLVTVVPAIWAAFFFPVSWGLLGFWLLTSLCITIPEMIVLSLALGPPPGDVNFVFLVLNAAQIGVVFFVLRILAGIGFRLTRT